MWNKPLKLIYIGAAGLLIGWLVALFSVMRIIPLSFIVLFGSYIISIVGLVVGLIGVYTHFPFRRR